MRARLEEPAIIDRLKTLDETPADQLTEEQVSARAALQQVRALVIDPNQPAFEQQLLIPHDFEILPAD